MIDLASLYSGGNQNKQFQSMGLDSTFGALDKYFGGQLKDMGWSGSVFDNSALMSGVGELGLSKDFSKWMGDQGLSTSLWQGDGEKTLRLMRGNDILGEKTYQTQSGLDKFADVAVPLAIALGSGGVLGQALGFINPALNPLDMATWGAGSGGAAAGGASAVEPLAADAFLTSISPELSASMTNLPGLSAAPAAASPYALSGSSLSPSTAAALSPYELTGAKFGSSGATGGLTGTGSGLGVGNTATATATMGKAAPGTLSSYIDKLLSPEMVSGAKKAIPGLMQVYSGINQRNNAKRLMGQITGLGKAGGPYEQMLRKQLERRDAAAGRRSQYGPREVELQAKLAELMMRNSGSLASLMGQQQSGIDSMLKGAYFGGRNLLDIFGGGD